MVETKEKAAKKTKKKKTVKKGTAKETAKPASKDTKKATKKKSTTQKAPAVTKKKKTKKPSKVQPEVNIGLVGHVDHGKTTLTERFSGKWTDTHSEELRRGITIRLGYADTTFYYCKKCKRYTVKENCETCGGETEFKRKVSFVDAPGHESLMATMISGATIMDGAILLVAANEECPQPQTKEHLMALSIMGIKNLIIVQNKIDLVDEKEALENYNQINNFIKGSKFEGSPIIPISAQHGANIDMLIQTIEEKIPTPERDITKEPHMLIARSFDINKPGTDPLKLSGGVLGGALIQGKLKEGDFIEIAPGMKIEKDGKVSFKPFKTKITSIYTGSSRIDEVVPGGSIAIGTKLDPSVVKSDSLTGNVVGIEGKLPPTWNYLKLKTKLLKRVVGSKEDVKVDPLKMNEILMLNVNAAATVGVVKKIQKDHIECFLKLPICAQEGSRVTISRRVGSRFRLIGFGMIEE